MGKGCGNFISINSKTETQRLKIKVVNPAWGIDEFL